MIIIISYEYWKTRGNSICVWLAFMYATECFTTWIIQSNLYCHVYYYTKNSAKRICTNYRHFTKNEVFR